VTASTVAGKVVWITGASSGIGEALATALAARDASLVLSARREDVLRKVESACQRSGEHLVLPLDMLEPSSFEPAVQTVLDRFGRVDILIHCAGISQRGTAVETQLQVDRHLIELNYLGPVALTKRVLPSMIARRAGHIVAVSSLLGKFAVPERSAYCASKHALHGFFDALRAEVQVFGIDITLICPGFVHTNASFNALTVNGTQHGKLDKEIKNGLPSDECARRIVRAIERRRREVYIARKERLAVYFSRYAPGLFHRVIRATKLK
jgi:short-subunit dehydrogenase